MIRISNNRARTPVLRLCQVAAITYLLTGETELTMKKIFILALVLGAGWHFYTQPGQVTLGPGVQVEEAPWQQAASSPDSHRVDDYTITEFAEFRMKAKVLSKKNYFMGREADLSPTDLTLGWGNMSDESILDKIEISQSGRFYRWRVTEFPVPRREIETSSANMHLIPATDAVASVIQEIRNGDIIQLSGSLVKVLSDEDGWRCWFLFHGEALEMTPLSTCKNDPIGIS